MAGILEERSPMGILAQMGQTQGGALTANPNMLAQAARMRQNRPAPSYPTIQGLLDTSALATAPVPVLGDILGLGSDIHRFATDPASRTAANFGLSALGLLPLVPNMAMFAGPLAKTADLTKKQIAEGMEKAGGSRDDIWKETGWFKGPDGKWRFEIDDSQSSIKTGDDWMGYMGTDQRFMHGAQMQDVYSHPELYSAYPNMRDFPVQSAEYGTGIAMGGGAGERGIARVSAPNAEKLRQVTAHETQHLIQGQEGFAKGGSPSQMATEYSMAVRKMDFDSTVDALAQTAVKDFGGSVDAAAKELNKIGIPVTQEHIDALMKMGEKQARESAERSMNALRAYGRKSRGDPGKDLYHRLAGEAEARAVEARMNLTPAQRAATPPWQSYDVPWDQLIFR